MRKKILGAVAALSAAAGGAIAQAPARSVVPMPIGPAGMPADPQVRQANADVFNPAVPPPGFGPGGMVGDPSMGMPGGMPGGPGYGMEAFGPGGPGGPPGYPPPGPYGMTPYDQPVLEREGGLFDATGTHRFYINGQYLLMFPKDQPSGYPLLSTSAPADFGRVPNATTTLLAGGSGTLGLGTVSGFRLNAGLWRPEDGRLGIEVGGMYLSPTSFNYFAKSSDQGIPLIARPFVNSTNGADVSLLVSTPNAISGSALVRATTEFYGIEANALYNLYRTCPGQCRMWELNVIGGYRYAELEETLNVSSRSTILTGTLPVAGVTASSPSSIEVRDQFSTLNKFHGAQIGFDSRFTADRWYVGVSGKAAFGMANQRATIEGSTGLSNPTARTSSITLGGLYANASNIGRYNGDKFAVLTDLNGTVGFHFTKWLTGTVGYNFIHMSNAVRPGNFFNGRVDPSLVPTSGLFGSSGVSARTAVSPRADDFWVHGLNFGFILRY